MFYNLKNLVSKTAKLRDSFSYFGRFLNGKVRHFEGDLYMVHADLLEIAPENQRSRTEDNISPLAEAMKEDGQKNPLIVRYDNRKKKFLISDGASRKFAGDRIGLKQYIVSVANISELDGRLLGFRCNSTTQDYLPIDKLYLAEGIIKKYPDISYADAAKKMGLNSKQAFQQLIHLKELTPEIQSESLKYPCVTESHLRKIAEIPKEKQWEVFQAIIKGQKISSREVANLANSNDTKPSGKKLPANTIKDGKLRLSATFVVGKTKIEDIRRLAILLSEFEKKIAEFEKVNQ